MKCIEFWPIFHILIFVCVIHVSLSSHVWTAWRAHRCLDSCGTLSQKRECLPVINSSRPECPGVIHRTTSSRSCSRNCKTNWQLIADIQSELYRLSNSPKLTNINTFKNQHVRMALPESVVRFLKFNLSTSSAFWMRDGSALLDGREHLTTGNLHLPYVQPEDSGIYMYVVQVKNDVHRLPVVAAIFAMHVAPYEKLDITNGTFQNLRCPLKSVERFSYEINWYKDGKVVRSLVNTLNVSLADIGWRKGQWSCRVFVSELQRELTLLLVDVWMASYFDLFRQRVFPSWSTVQLLGACLLVVLCLIALIVVLSYVVCLIRDTEAAWELARRRSMNIASYSDIRHLINEL